MEIRSSSSSSSEIETEIHPLPPHYIPLSLIMEQDAYLTAPSKLFDSFEDGLVLSSGETMLAVIAVVSSSALSDSLDGRILRAVENWAPGRFIYTGRILNTPLEGVCELYKRMAELLSKRATTEGSGSGTQSTGYLFVSQLSKQNKKQVEAAVQLFPDYTEKDLRYFPKKAEEVFLYGVPRRMRVDTGTGRCGLYWLEDEELDRFVEVFERELSVE